MDKGSKFVPCFFQDSFSFLLYSKFFLLQFLKDFNKRIFFLNNKYKNKNINKVLDSTNTNNTDNLPGEFMNANDIDSILKKLAIEKRIDQYFPLQMETVDLEFLLYKEFNKIKFDKQLNNIKFEEFQAIKYFIKNKPFKITDCDKNVGIAIISSENYISLSELHLKNPTNFQQLTENTLETTQELIQDKLLELKNNGSISKRLFNNLLLSEYKHGSFRILPKLHKKKFGTRPIINCIKHPTSNLSLFVDAVMQPYVQSSNTFIRDSQNLIQRLEEMTFDDNVKLCSFDFESLYSNIDLKHALVVISDFMSDKITSDHFNIASFHQILKLIFDNNIFSFDKRYYRQITGVAMGSKCGPTIANIYLLCLESKFLSIYNPPFYARFIDDIFSVLPYDFDTKLLTDNNIFHNLKLNEVCSNTVDFLDLKITLDVVTRKLIFSLYIKPTNTFSYLLTSSNHPEFIFKNIPLGILIRYRRICSKDNDFLSNATRTKFQLVSRGYDYDKINKIIDTLASTPRSVFLSYKNKKSFIKNDTLILSKLFDFNLNNTSLINNSINSLSEKFNILKHIKYNIINKIQPNLGAILVNNIFSYKFNLRFFNFVKCNREGCRICEYSLDLKYI